MKPTVRLDHFRPARSTTDSGPAAAIHSLLRILVSLIGLLVLRVVRQVQTYRKLTKGEGHILDVPTNLDKHRTVSSKGLRHLGLKCEIVDGLGEALVCELVRRNIGRYTTHLATKTQALAG